MSSPRQPSYYEILNLSPSAIDDAYQKGGETSSAQLIKRAYRRALLSHHPDKQQQQQQKPHPRSNNTTATAIINTDHTTDNVNDAGYQYTIDQISQAFAILSSPSQRSLYDRQLKTNHQNQSGIPTEPSRPLFQTGIENIDLDDLESFQGPTESAESGQEDIGEVTYWYRPCRCGNPRGYLFSESDLEEAIDLGELMVGCADCSLWLRVHFAVLEEDEEEEEKEEEDDNEDDDRKEENRQDDDGGRGGDKER